MNEKVKVSREVAKAIEYVKENYKFESSLRVHLSENWHSSHLRCLKELSTEAFVSLLLNGYEIEETPEEKLLATYQRQRTWQETNDPYDRRAHTAYGNAIVYTLDTLGIKIKGINE
ncbi:hypothetical protein [Metasolibacillus sp.]|uniref:hypothetical protein n=1 Tax=Metasolibacillus sp. TaxID=2703680 RepID=UPI0025E4FE96|nr:hypothetical protein [Metasolibacillus sp.]MCT6924594.1 hypothetical protein [Metasolibacillus sp.]MCT6940796.1 hypothetical protein [Metasolibacillus sp.]